MSRVRIQWVLFFFIAISISSQGFTQQRTDFRILYEAGAGGVSGSATRDALQGHWVNEAGEALSIQGAGYGALYSTSNSLQGGGYLFLQEATAISGLLSFLETASISVIESAEVSVLSSRQGIYLKDFHRSFESASQVTEGAAVSLSPGHLMEEVRVERWALYRIENVEGAEAFLLHPGAVEGALDIALLPSTWEVRLRTDYRLASAEDGDLLIGFERRLGEGTRRLRYVQHQRDIMGVNTAFVSAGDSIEGQSWVMGESLNLQRPGSFSALDGLLDVLVPASGELASGIGPLKEDAENASISLVSANVMAADSGEPAFQTHYVHEDEELHIVFIGLTDPAVFSELPPEVQDEIHIAAPQESLTRVVSSLYSQGETPDFVVLVTGLTGERQDILLSDSRGVDLIIGPESASGELDMYYGWQDASEQLQVSYQPGDSPSERSLIHRFPGLASSVQPQEIGQLDLFMVDGRVDRIVHELLLVDQGWPAMRGPLEEINRVRQAVYVDHEEEMLWDWRGAPLRLKEIIRGLLEHFQGEEGAAVVEGGYNYGLWSTLVANLMRLQTGADVALLRAIPHPPVWVGSVNELALNEALRERDLLLLYRMDGARLSQLLALRGSRFDVSGSAEQGEWPPMISGADSRSQTVSGRPIESRAGYTVVVTDYYANESGVREILNGLTPERRFLFNGEEWVPDESGALLYLHEMVVSYLDALQQQQPSEGSLSARDNALQEAAYWEAYEALLVDPGGTRNPLIRLDIEEISLLLNQVTRAASESGYEDVRNSRVTQGESLTLSARADAACVLDTEPVIVSLGGRMAYGQLRVEGESTENADDLVAELDLQIRYFDFGWARGFRPYVTSRFDTEFTPAEPSEDGAESIPRQQEMNNSAGLVADFSAVFPEFRLGLVQFTDFAKTEDRGALGAELILTEQVQWGPVSQGLRIQGNYYFPTDSDSAEDLGLTLNSRFNLAVPLIGPVALEAFVDTLLFRGKLESNDEFGLNIQTGFGLTYGDVFRRPLR